MEKQNIIVTAEEILEVIDKEYPDKQPMEELSPYEQGKLVGQRMIIEHIRSLLG